MFFLLDPWLINRTSFSWRVRKIVMNCWLENILEGEIVLLYIFFFWINKIHGQEIYFLRFYSVRWWWDPNNFIPKWLLKWGMWSNPSSNWNCMAMAKGVGVKKIISKKRLITLAGHWCVIPSGKQHYDPKQQKPFPTLILNPTKIIYVNRTSSNANYSSYEKENYVEFQISNY